MGRISQRAHYGAVAGAFLSMVLLAGLSVASPAVADATAGLRRDPVSGQKPIAAAAAAAKPMAWTGEATGGVFIQRHRDNEDPDPDQRLVVDDQQTYKGHFTFSFQILPGGTITGSGKGEYDEATWHLEGTNGDKGFSCDPPLISDPFKADVTGSVSGRTIKLKLDLPDAYETNEDYDCGADFTAFGGTSQTLRKSLETAGGGDLSFDMTTPGTKTLTKQEVTSSGEFKEIIKDHNWTVTVKHDCAESDYDKPSETDYINQFAAGEELDLPDATSAAGGKAGGNACGPSSLAMLLNAAKAANDKTKRFDLKDVYTDTMVNGFTADGENNSYSQAKGKAHAHSLGFLTASGNGADYINEALDLGNAVIVSTRFSSKASSSANPYGDGHVILVTGRTADGDYIVSDPAGDYFASDSGHYGKDKCGDNVVYPKDTFVDRLKSFDGSATAISYRQSADPRVLLLIGRYSGVGPSPYNLWIEDENGLRTGFLPSGAKVEQIPTSEGSIDPQYESNPDAPEPAGPPPLPQTVSVEPAAATGDLHVFLEGDRASDYRLEVVVFENGVLSRDTYVTGSIEVGETKEVELDLDLPTSRITHPGNGSVVPLAKAGPFTGTARDALSGIKAVRYTLEDAGTHRFYNPGSKRFNSREPIELKAQLGRALVSSKSVEWKAPAPGAIRSGRRYVLRVFALDRAGNLQVTVKAGVNLVKFRIAA